MNLHVLLIQAAQMKVKHSWTIFHLTQIFGWVGHGGVVDHCIHQLIYMLDPLNYTEPIVDRPQMAVLLTHL